MYIVERNQMYIVEIIDPEKAKLVYRSEVFSDQEEAEECLKEVCEDTHDLEGIIVSVSLEKTVFNNLMNLTSAEVVYHT